MKHPEEDPISAAVTQRFLNEDFEDVIQILLSYEDPYEQRRERVREGSIDKLHTLRCHHTRLPRRSLPGGVPGRSGRNLVHALASEAALRVLRMILTSKENDQFST